MRTTHEFEKAILGRVILEPETSDYAFEKLTSDCFYSEEHRIVFEHVRDLWETNSTIDTLSVCHRLESNDLLKKVGGQEGIVEIVDCAAIPSSLDHYVDQVLEAKRSRALRVLGNEISNKVAGQKTSEEIISTIESRLNEITDNSYKDSFSTLENLSITSLSGNSKSYPTNFIDLDKKIGGLPHGEFWVLAGRPSVGKTALGLNLLVNLARQEIPCGFLSLEMSMSALKQRIVASEVRMKFDELQNEEKVEQNREKLEETIQNLRQLPVYFDASPSQSIISIKAKTHRLVRLHQIRVLFVDYLQLIEGPKAETREREISAISARLKALATELGITVVGLCQLNRRCEERGDKRPVLADLRESGAIEQDADGVLLLHRPELYRIKQFDDGSSTSGVVEVNVAKNRNGETGVFRLTFLKKFTRFENYEKGER